MTELDLVNTRRVLEAFGEETVESMRNILISNGKDASGELIRSLSYQITYEESDIDIEFSMVDYGQFVDKGRKPGKQPPISSISKWLAIKGIPQKFAFPIARKIGLKGIEPTPFFDSTISDKTRELISSLEIAYSKDIEVWIRNNFTK